MLCKELFEFAGVTMIGGETKDLAVTPEEKCVIRLAQAGRRFDQSVEHELQIEGRAADDLEHFGGGGLLRPRFVQFAHEHSDGFLFAVRGVWMARSERR